MTIEELVQEHYDIHFGKKYEINPPNYHTKLSIQFAIEVLESLDVGKCYECSANFEVEDKIQELKQYLDERNTN